MSNVIDEKIVEMSFDNSEFERNIKQSMDSIDDLKESLDFSKPASSFKNDITSSFNGIDFGTVGAALGTLGEKFSVLEIMATTAIANIANDITNKLKSAVNSLTMEQITAGFGKYEDKTSAVQTIMAATGLAIEDVNEQLDKLNWFTDETSYNFVDMVSNIGKFTSAGVELGTATKAMEGIANWAAISGAGPAEASRAMYNLSQAMAAGAVKLMDWRSIENANMGTMEFKNTVLESAVATGTLTKALDENGKAVYRTLGGTLVTAENFNTTLAEGWFTSEALLASLDKYGGAADSLYGVVQYWNNEGLDLTATDYLTFVDEYNNGMKSIEQISRETGLSIETVQGILNSFTSDTGAFGIKAFRAAQEAKTFSDAIDATKDAVSTAWMNIMEDIFGDYTQAKVLWTDLANYLWDAFAGPVWAIEEVVNTWANFARGGRTDLFDSLFSVWDSLNLIIGTVKDAFADLFPPVTAKNLRSMVLSLRSFAQNLEDTFYMTNWGTRSKPLQQIYDTFHGIFSIFDLGKQLVSAVWGGFKRLFSELTKGTKPVLEYTSSLGKLLTSFHDMVTDSDIFNVVVNKIVDGIITLVQWLRTGFQVARDFVSALVPSELLSGAMSSAIDFFTEKFGGIHISMSTIIDTLSDFKDKFTSTFDSIGNSSGFKGFTTFFTTVGTVLSTVWSVIKSVVGRAVTAIVQLGGSMKNSLIEGGISGLIDMLLGLVTGGAIFKVIELINAFIESTKDLRDKSSGFLEKVSGILSGVKDVLKSYQDQLKAKTLQAIASAVVMLAGSILVLSFIKSEKAQQAVGIITMLFGELVGSLAIISNGGLNAKGLGGLITLALSVLVLTTAVSKIGKLDVEVMQKGLIGVGAMLLELVGFTALMQKAGKFKMSSALGFILLATSIRILAGGVEDIGNMSWDVIGRGLTGIGGILLEFVAYSALMKRFGGGSNILKNAGAIVLAFALKEMVDVVADIASYSWPDILKGLQGAGLIMLELVAYSALMKLFGGGSNILKNAGALILAETLVKISNTIKELGGSDQSTINRGLIVSGEILGGLAVITRMFSSATSMLSIAIGMIAITSSLKGLAEVIGVIGSMNSDTLLVGLSGVAGMMLVIGGVIASLSNEDMSSQMGNFAANAAKMFAGVVLLSLTMKILADLLSSIAELGGETILTGLLGFAGVVAVLILASKTLGDSKTVSKLDNFAKALIKISGAVFLFGAGLALLGTGVAMFSTITGAFELLGALIVTIVDSAITAIIQLVPTIVAAMVDGIVLFINTIKEMGDKIGGAISDLIETWRPIITQLISSVLSLLRDNAPDIVETVLVLLDELLASLSDHFPSIITSIQGILDKLFTWLIEYSPQLVTFFVEFITGVLDGIVENADSIISSLVNLIITLIDAVGEKAPEIIEHVTSALSSIFEAIGGMILSLVDVVVQLLDDIVLKLDEKLPGFISDLGRLFGDILASLGEYVSQIITGAGDMVVSICNAIGEKAPEVMKAGADLLVNLWDGITDSIVIIVDGAYTVIIDFLNGLTDAMNEHQEELNQAVWDFIKAAIVASFGMYSTIWNDAKDAAKDLIDNGLIAGFADKLSDLKDAALNLFTGGDDPNSGVIGTIKGVWSSMKSAGQHLVGGLVAGFTDQFTLANLQANITNVGDNIVSWFKDKLGIHSPSVVMAELGTYLLMGLGNGIISSEKYALNSVDEVGDDVIESMSSVISEIYERFENTDATPTITPILDFSEIQNELPYLSSILNGGSFGIPVTGVGASSELSELNFTLDKLSRLMSDSSDRDPSPINITINATSDQDPSEIADEVSRILDEQYRRRKAVYA